MFTWTGQVVLLEQETSNEGEGTSKAIAGAEESSERWLTLDKYQRKDETLTKIKAVGEYNIK